MPLTRPNPTRMQLIRLKKQLKTARRGHRLLKDKRDELMKRFLEMIREALDQRKRMESVLSEAGRLLRDAALEADPDALDQALSLQKLQAEVSVAEENILSVRVPVFALEPMPQPPLEALPYGFYDTPLRLDDALLAYRDALPLMVRTAQLEQSCRLLAREIEKTRRRVNALEYVMIPTLEEHIRTIAMKLEENERGNLTRLMKVKSMILEQSRKSGDTAPLEETP